MELQLRHPSVRGRVPQRTKVVPDGKILDDGGPQGAPEPVPVAFDGLEDGLGVVEQVVWYVPSERRQRTLHDFGRPAPMQGASDT